MSFKTFLFGIQFALLLPGFAAEPWNKPQSLSVDLSKCQYAQATGESERLETFGDRLIKNGDFSRNDTALWNPKMAKGASFSIQPQNGYAQLDSVDDGPSEISQRCVFPALKKSEKIELYLTYASNQSNKVKMQLVIGFYNQDGKEARPPRQKNIALATEFQKNRTNLVIPEGTASISLAIRVSGNGTVKLKNIGLYRGEGTTWVSVRATPAAFMDNIVALEDGQPGFLTLGFKNSRKIRPQDVKLFLTLPKEFQIKATTFGFKLLKSIPQGKNITYVLKEQMHSIPSTYKSHNGIGTVILQSSCKSGETLYPATYHLEYAGTKTKPYTTYLKIIPSFGKAKTPTRFLSGFIGSGDLRYNNEGNGAETYMNYARKTGFNSAQITNHRELNDAAKKAKIIRMWSDWRFVNGYTLGDGEKTEAAKFRDVNQKAVALNKWQTGICPVEAYTHGEYFKKHVIGFIEENLIQKDFGEHIIANWEPEWYDFKGCFCNRCKSEFIKYSKLLESEVNLKWPKQILSSYRKVWVKFRSWQHAKLMVAIREELDKLEKKHGRKIIFVPEIAWSNLILDKPHVYDQYDAMDYLDKLEWIDPWGPYIYHQFNKAFTYRIGENLNTYVAAGKMKEVVAKRMPDPKKRTKLLAFPHGRQVFSWVTTPEALAYETLAFFAQGWEGSYAYLFPVGYDARYYKTMTDANNKIGSYETFILDGKPGQYATCEVLTPLPGPAYVYEASAAIRKFASDITKEKLLTINSYRLGEKTLIALGNAWSHGDAFVKVKVPGLDSKKKYVVWSPDANMNFGYSLLAKELEQGLTLHVPLLGWSFFVVETAEPGKKYGKYYSQSEIISAMQKRLGDLQKSYEEDQNLIKESNDTVFYSFDESISLKNGAFLIQPKNKNLSASVLEVITPDWQAEIDMGSGGKISLLKTKNGTVFANPASGGVMRDGFWAPTNAICINSGVYRFLKWEAIQDGIAVELEGRISPKQCQFLRGITIRKRYIFHKNEIQLSVTVINGTSREIDMAYRLHNMPYLIAKNGKFVIDDKEYSRPGKDTFFPFNKRSISTMPFGAQEHPLFKKSAVSVKGENGTVLTLDILTPEQLQGLYVWDSKTASCPSMEIYFQKMKLEKSQKVNFSFRYKF